MNTRVVLGQPSWQIQNELVEAYVTELGGHVGPISFRLPSGQAVQPLSVPPWAEEPLDEEIAPYARVLRGDFFCMPFGANDAPFRDEVYPIHGETANERWTFESLGSSLGRTTLRLSLETRVWPGHVTKEVELVDGHCAVYQTHTLRGFEGPMCYGTHPMIRFPDRQGSGLVSLSPFAFGQVYPGDFEEPAHKGYSYLKPGATFARLDSIPTANGGLTDLSRYPSHAGFDDQVMVLADPHCTQGWSAVVFPERGYVWFALKDNRQLNGTVLWISNGGRHYEPWRGRHTGVMGIEEVTAYFGFGLGMSADNNPIRQRGFPTSVDMEPDKPVEIRTVMAVHPISKGCGHVHRITQTKSGVELEFTNGCKAEVPLDASFVWG